MPDPIAQGDLGVNMCQTNHTKKGVVWINPSNNHAHRTCWLIDYWGAGSSSSRNTWNRTISLQRLLIKGLGYSAVSFDYCCVIGGRTTHLRNIFANLGTRISNFKQEQKHNAFQTNKTLLMILVHNCIIGCQVRTATAQFQWYIRAVIVRIVQRVRGSR